MTSRLWTWGSRKVTRLPPVIATLVTVALACPGLEASIDFLETYDDLAAQSTFTLELDLDNNFTFETVVTGPLRGRADVELRLSDTGPMAQLEALRVKRLTLFADPVINVSSLGFEFAAHNFSIHMGDGLGQPTTFSQLGLKLASDAYTWSQGAPNVIALRGTIRGTGPAALAELLDVSEHPPFSVALAGEWEWLGLGAQSRFRAAAQLMQEFQTRLPFRTRFTAVVQQSGAFVGPPPPVDFAAWAASFGLSGAAAEIGADPDRDGRVNLDEFAFGLDPSAPQPIDPAVTVDVRNDHPVYVFVRDTTRSSVEFHLESSDDLITWKTIAHALPGADARGSGGGVVIEEKFLGAGRYRVVVRDPFFALDDRQRFARVRLVRR